MAMMVGTSPGRDRGQVSRFLSTPDALPWLCLEPGLVRWQHGLRRRNPRKKALLDGLTHSARTAPAPASETPSAQVVRATAGKQPVAR